METTIERIKKDAGYYEGMNNYNGVFDAYRQGAISERNKTIEDVIERLESTVEFGYLDRPFEYVKEGLERLKIDLKG